MAESYVTILSELDEDRILADLNAIAIELGLINNVFETSRIYIFYAVFARVFGNLIKTIVEYIENLDIEKCTDEALLDILIKPFIKKRNAKVAKVILEFSRRDTTDTQASDIFIPREFEVMTEGEDPLIFRTAESRILWKDAYKVLIPAYSVEFGSLNNISANTLTYFNDAEFANIQVTNPQAAYGATDEETAFDARNRIGLFRYGRDGSKDFLQQLIFENGVSYYGYNIIEYWDGYGSVLIVLDIQSEDEFADIVQNIEMMKRDGVKYYYSQCEYVYINIICTIKMLKNDRIYTTYDKNAIEENIKTAIELYFKNNINKNKKLSKNRLEAFLLQYLVDEQYDIYETEIEISSNTELNKDPNTGQILVEEYQKLQPNKIRTYIEYDGE